MAHEAMVMIIERLIDSGLRETDALLLVGKLLYEESEEFLAALEEDPDTYSMTILN